jgi:hypothetical protein
MRNRAQRTAAIAGAIVVFTSLLAAQTNNQNSPTWWDKYTYLVKNGESPLVNSTATFTFGSNVDVSNECFPQSEVYITLNRNNPKILTAGSNEIFRDPMRGYFSSDGGKSWLDVDLPLPPPLSGTNDSRFGSDPTLAYDSSNNVYYGYIVVFFGGGNGVNGSQMAVARSTDGGKTYPQVSYFGFQTGSNHFNDKPMITADANPGSPFRDNVYIAWDASSGGSIGGGVRLAASADNGNTFSNVRIDDPKGPGKSIGAVPFTGPNGELYAAWNDYAANTIAFNRSFDGGKTWDTPVVVSSKSLAFDIAIPAEFSRGALVYPACDADRSGGAFNGRLYCAWMDLTASGTTDIFLSFSDDHGSTWSRAASVTDALPNPVDRFNHWLSVDPVTGEVNVAFYDTRNDTTGQRYQTDYYLARSSNGGATFDPNIRVSNQSSNEHDCNGVFPCSFINYGNQQGDYAGLVANGGLAHPIWVDSRINSLTTSACRRGFMEEVFTATVK